MLQQTRNGPVRVQKESGESWNAKDIFESDEWTQEPEANKKDTPETVRRRFPVVATRSGNVSPRPNLRWALERELDARFRELMDTEDESEKIRLQGECHGIAVGISAFGVYTIEQITRRCMQRYREYLREEGS